MPSKSKRANVMPKLRSSSLVSNHVLLPTGKFMRRWNATLIVLLAFTAVVTPYEARPRAGAAPRVPPPPRSC